MCHPSQGDHAMFMGVLVTSTRCALSIYWSRSSRRKKSDARRPEPRFKCCGNPRQDNINVQALLKRRQTLIQHTALIHFSNRSRSRNGMIYPAVRGNLSRGALSCANLIDGQAQRRLSMEARQLSICIRESLIATDQ